MTATIADLNLRSGPGTSNPVLAVIPDGATVTVTGSASGGWYPVTYQGQAGWVSGAYLRDIVVPAPTMTRDRARDALLSYLHIPYIWGGQSRAGLDCSGLVGLWWVDVGFRPKGFDSTADKLYDSYRTNQLPAERLQAGMFGALAFYGSGTYAGHVVICYDEVTVIGANGGSTSTDTAAKARAKNACVRLDRIDYRSDLLGIWLPHYEWGS